MKAGITVSAVAHALLLAGAMVSLASTKPLQAPDVEALPVDLVPFEELTKSVQGDKEAPLEDKPSPKETTAPETRPEAVNAGNAEDDRKADAEREAPEPPVERTEAPSAPAVPQPEPPKPQPTPELAPEPEPKKDIAMLLRQEPDPQAAEPAEETFENLPQEVATPKPRPAAPKPERAQTNDRRIEDKIAESQKQAEDREKDDVRKKAVVNKTEAEGGAKRSERKASAGTSKPNNAAKLAQSEIDALRGRLEACWNVGDLTGHPDAGTMKATVTFKLSRAGDIEGRVKVKVAGTSGGMKATFATRVKSAVYECAPYTLPPEKYATWADVVVNFSLADML